MKKKLLLLMGIFSIGIIHAQIGINTEEPQALVHIDAKGDTSGATNTSDDVMVSTDGRVGIGTLTPASKLDIVSATIGGGLRIEDGSEQQNKALMSDANGVGSWMAIGSSWFAALLQAPGEAVTAVGISKLKGFVNASISNSTQGSVNATTGDIVVPFTGYYKISFTSWFGNHWHADMEVPYRAMVMLYINGAVSDWTPYVYGTTKQYGVSPTYIQMKRLSAGDVLSIYMNHSSTLGIDRWAGSGFIVEFY